LGSHQLTALDFIENRPDTLHRRHLFQHLQAIIANAIDPIPVSTLYTQSPHSSPFQIQRTLNDLLRMGQIERPARGFYAQAPANPVFPTDATTQTSFETPPDSDPYWERMAQEAMAKTNAWNEARARQDATSSGTLRYNPFWIHFERLMVEEAAARGNLTSEPTNELNEPAATTPTPEPTNELNEPAATTPTPEPTNELNEPAATTPTPEPTNELNEPAATTPTPEPANSPNPTTITSQSLRWITS
jgi:hypothetical protein